MDPDIEGGCVNDPIITPPHFRNLPSAKSRFIQTVTTIAAFFLCVVILAAFFWHGRTAR